MRRRVVLSLGGVILFSTGLAAESRMNPRRALGVRSVDVLWSAGEAPGSPLAAQARFSPDGRWLAWRLSHGELVLHTLADASTKVVWSAPAQGRIVDLAWSSSNRLAACSRAMPTAIDDGAVWIMDSDETIRLLEARGAEQLAWRDDGQALAWVSSRGLFLHDVANGGTTHLLKSPPGGRSAASPAYENPVFVGAAVAAREGGGAAWTLVYPDGRTVPLGDCRGLAPDPARHVLYVVPWVDGPVGIPRGAGILRLDLNQDPPARTVVVPFDTAAPYWLVDVWDWDYPTTLRVAPDGMTLSFTGVQAGVLASNVWREFRLWEAPTDGRSPPVAKADMGMIFKRFDVGAHYGIGWRYGIDTATILVDFRGQQAWRLPRAVEIQRVNTDVLMERRLIGAARGRDVVLIQLDDE